MTVTLHRGSKSGGRGKVSKRFSCSKRPTFLVNPWNILFEEKEIRASSFAIENREMNWYVCVYIYAYCIHIHTHTLYVYHIINSYHITYFNHLDVDLLWFWSNFNCHEGIAPHVTVKDVSSSGSAAKVLRHCNGSRCFLLCFFWLEKLCI